MAEFAPNSDQELREGIREFYYHVVNESQTPGSIFIKLPINAWVSACALNMLLTFIEAVRLRDPQSRIFIEIIDSDTVAKVMQISGRVTDTDRTLLNVAKKLCFYEAMEFVNHLRTRRIVVQPSREIIKILQGKLDAFKASRRYLYSTRMLPLSPLVESDEDQFALTSRIGTLASILSSNLWGRLRPSDIEQASNQIMFELVKNVYQHNGLPEEYSLLARGFACAQINKYEIIQACEYPAELVTAVLEHIKRPIKGKKLAWLCVAINDFGVGIPRTVAHSLKERYDLSREVVVGRFALNESHLEDEALMIQIAATTDFSAKLVRIPQDLKDEWQVQDRVYALAGRGYGLIYCIGFIARTFGRMRIRSGSVELDIFPKPETPLEQEVWSNAIRAASELETRFPFEIRLKTLGPKARAFPGTQLLIEIPVEVWPKAQSD